MNNDTSDTPTIQIPLTKGFFAIVDPIDADLASMKWQSSFPKNAHTTVYARGAVYDINAYRHQRHIQMHRLILERMLGRSLISHELCDHINGDGLDNRRCNLRVATNQQNQGNKKYQINNTSGYKGVHWCRFSRKWHAQITISNVRTNLGYYDSIRDAIVAYNAASLSHFGEFAYQNPLPENEGE